MHTELFENINNHSQELADKKQYELEKARRKKLHAQIERENTIDMIKFLIGFFSLFALADFCWWSANLITGMR